MNHAFIAAAHAAGMPPGLSSGEQDRWIAKRLGVAINTARGYRCGYSPVPEGQWTSLTGENRDA